MDHKKKWCDLPMELLRVIAERVPPSSLPWFSSVCKSWYKASPRVFRADTCPMLLHFQGNDVCHFYSPLHHKTFAIECPPHLFGTQLLFAKDGWLMVHRGYEISLVNPFTGSKCDVPPIGESSLHGHFAFTGLPTSPDFIIFYARSRTIDWIELAIFRGGEWSPLNEHWHGGVKFWLCSNPVFYHGIFCCLSLSGDIGLFDPNDDSWSVVSPVGWPEGSRNRAIGSPSEFEGHIFKERVSMIKSEGHIMAMIISPLGFPAHILRLNHEKLIWEEVSSSLGNMTLFVGSPVAVAVTTGVTKMKNKIYTDRFSKHPEILKAELKCSEDRGIYFVADRSSSNEAGQGEEDSSGDIICYTLGSDECPLAPRCNELKYLSSIWVEPKFALM